MAHYRMVNGTLVKTAGSATNLVFSVTIPVQNWTPDGKGGAYIDVAVNGINAADNPIVALEILDGDTPTSAKEKRIAFSCIDRIDTYDNSLRVFCLDINQVPTTQFSILVRK